MKETGTLRHLFYFADRSLVLDPRRGYTIGRLPEADIHLDERTVSRKHATLTFVDSAWQIEDNDSTNGTSVNYARIDESTLLKDGDHISIGPFVCIYRSFSPGSAGENEFNALLNETLILEGKIHSLADRSQDRESRNEIYNLKFFLNSLMQRLNSLANIDRLTGLFNRRFLDQQLVLELARAERYKRALGLIMIDIDHFKEFNDRHGHQKGDEVLAAVGKILSDNTRKSDLAARFGGEELTVLLPEVTPGQAQLAAEKIRRQIETESLEHTGLTVTASIGVAVSTQQGITAAELIRRADEALYRAKQSGRNRVEAAP